MYARRGHYFDLIFYSIRIDFYLHRRNHLYAYNFDNIAVCIPVHVISTCLYSKQSQCSKESV